MLKLRKIISIAACTLAVAAIVTLSSCANAMQKSIPLKTGSSKLTTLIRTSATESMLDTPSQIFVSKNESSTEIKISWSAVDNAASYVLERAIVDPTNLDANDPPEDTDFVVLKNFVYDTQYEDIVVDPETEASADTPAYTLPQYINGYKYYYRVSACNVSEGYDQSEPTANTNYGTLLKPVSNVEAEMGKSTSSIGITWDKVENASRYDIYRSENSDGSAATKLASVSANLTNYTNSISSAGQGIEYYYSVKAVTALGEESISSALALGYTLTGDAPSAPEITSVGRGDPSRIELVWTASSGNASIGGDDVHYTIYRSSSVDSSKTIVLKDTESVRWTDTKASTGVYYYYYVKPWFVHTVTGDTVAGGMSEKAEGFILSPSATVSTAKKTNGNHVISFSVAIGNEEECAAYSYNVYGSTTVAGTGSNDSYENLVASGITNDTNYSADAEMLVYEIPNGSTYDFYKVSTTYNGGESKQSSASSPAPLAPSSISVTRNAAIAGTTPSYDVASADGGPNANGVMPVVITWRASSMNDAAGYILYRAKFNSSKNSYGSFVKLTDTLSNTTFSYTDVNPTAKQEEVYGYKVQAINTLGQGNKDSYTEAYWGYGALCVEQLMAQSSITSKYAQRPPAQGGGLKALNEADDNAKMTGNGVWEYNYGQVSGQVAYNAVLTNSGSTIGADVDMPYTNYADFQINTPDGKLTTTIMNGKCNTFAGADLLAGFVIKGNLYGTMDLSGMYTGKIRYGNSKGDGFAKIGTKSDGTSGVNGGGYYVTTSGYEERWVDWTWGE